MNNSAESKQRRAWKLLLRRGFFLGKENSSRMFPDGEGNAAGNALRLRAKCEHPMTLASCSSRRKAMKEAYEVRVKNELNSKSIFSCHHCGIAISKRSPKIGSLTSDLMGTSSYSSHRLKRDIFAESAEWEGYKATFLLHAEIASSSLSRYSN